jgi:hypothetical protein
MALTADAGIDEGWRQRLRSRSAHHQEELADPRLDHRRIKGEPRHENGKSGEK